MKVKALARLSGRAGEREKEETFDLEAAHARELIERGLVEEVKTSSGDSAKKASAAKE